MIFPAPPFKACPYPHFRHRAIRSHAGAAVDAEAPTGRRVVATGGASPPEAGERNPWIAIPCIILAPAGRRTDALGPAFGRIVDGLCGSYAGRSGGPSGRGRTMTPRSTSSVRLRRTPLVATTRSPSGAQAGVPRVGGHSPCRQDVGNDKPFKAGLEEVSCRWHSADHDEIAHADLRVNRYTTFLEFTRVVHCSSNDAWIGQAQLAQVLEDHGQTSLPMPPADASF